MKKKVMTAPLGVIKVRGKAVGKMKNLTVTETFRRGRVSGIGRVTPDELPLLEWNGTISCGHYLVDMGSGIPESLKRYASNEQEFIDDILLEEEGVDIVILKKVYDQTLPSTVKKSKLGPFATVRGCFIDRESFDINEGQISGKNQDFTYSSPILVKPEDLVGG